ncbi:MAG TPA: hypothetical protein IGS40_05180 [Trichormus sp. M33_DOE_039]|nr:hypothetical protein [Trichormus sp. M33_DOE_039]
MWLRRAALLGMLLLCFRINFLAATPSSPSQPLILQMSEQNSLFEFSPIELHQLLILTLEQQQQLAINLYPNLEQILQQFQQT